MAEPEPAAALIERVAALARGPFAQRAAAYDRDARFPREDFDDLHREGLLAAALPRAHGGLGLGPHRRATRALWRITSLLAAADLSLARCWEAHCNALVLLDALGSDEQRRRWFAGVAARGEIWAAWSGEPQARKPGEAARFGTTATPVAGGWVVDGAKAFATSATAATRALLLVDPQGPGGARHATGPAAGLLLLACELADPSISVDESWWDPIGMRATVSHVVRFDKTFVPREDVVGEPGGFLAGGWQTAFVPHYAASFLGAARGAYDYALAYVREQGRAADPYVQQRVGAMACDLQTGELWLEHVAALWDAGRRPAAQLAGSQARHVVEHVAERTVQHCIRACGARSLIRPSPVERVLRDLTLYERHDNDDHVLATLGRAVLDERHDLAFHSAP